MSQSEKPLPNMVMDQLKDSIAPCRLGVTLVEFAFLMACEKEGMDVESSSFNNCEQPMRKDIDIMTMWNLHNLGYLRSYQVTDDGKKLIQDIKKIIGDL